MTPAFVIKTSQRILDPWPATASTRYIPELCNLVGIPSITWALLFLAPLSLSHPWCHPKHQGCCWGDCCNRSSSNTSWVQLPVAFYGGIKILKHCRRALGVYINNLLYIKSPKRNLCQSTESHSLRGPIPFVSKFNTLRAICNLKRKNIHSKGNTLLLLLCKIKKLILA